MSFSVFNLALVHAAIFVQERLLSHPAVHGRCQSRGVLVVRRQSGVGHDASRPLTLPVVTMQGYQASDYSSDAVAASEPQRSFGPLLRDLGTSESGVLAEREAFGYSRKRRVGCLEFNGSWKWPARGSDFVGTLPPSHCLCYRCTAHVDPL